MYVQLQKRGKGEAGYGELMKIIRENTFHGQRMIPLHRRISLDLKRVNPFHATGLFLYTLKT